jgi:hypothetical protein
MFDQLPVAVVIGDRQDRSTRATIAAPLRALCAYSVAAGRDLRPQIWMAIFAHIAMISRTTPAEGKAFRLLDNTAACFPSGSRALKGA